MSASWLGSGKARGRYAHCGEESTSSKVEPSEMKSGVSIRLDKEHEQDHGLGEKHGQVVLRCDGVGREVGSCLSEHERTGGKETSGARRPLGDNLRKVVSQPTSSSVNLQGLDAQE